MRHQSQQSFVPCAPHCMGILLPGKKNLRGALSHVHPMICLAPFACMHSCWRALTVDLAYIRLNGPQFGPQICHLCTFYTAESHDLPLLTPSVFFPRSLCVELAIVPLALEPRYYYSFHLPVKSLPPSFFLTLCSLQLMFEHTHHQGYYYVFPYLCHREGSFACNDELHPNPGALAVLVYRLVCQPVTLESWVRFPDAAA